MNQMNDNLLFTEIEEINVKIDSLVNMMKGKNQREFLTVKETAELLRCSKSSIRDKMRNGILPFTRTGNTETSPILIRRIDIDGVLK